MEIMKNKLYSSFFILAITITGCASGPPSYFRFIGPANKTQQEFINERYFCLKETQQRTSNTSVNQYGGSSSSSVIPSCSAFNACLASRGFYRQDTTDLSIFNQPGNFSVPQGAVINCTN